MVRNARLIVIVLLALGVSAGLLTGFGQVAGPVEAGGSWSAWLYNASTGQLVHVFPDGAPSVEMMFPLPPGTSNPPSAVTISPNGAMLAACLIDDMGNPSVRAYDIYNSTYVAAYIPSGPIEACALQRWSFNADGTLLAFGIMNYYPGVPDSRPNWELIVMQMQTSAIVHHITSNSPTITALGTNFAGMVPFVTAHEPYVIAFKPVAWGTEGWCEYDSLVWQLDGTNYVSMGGPYGKGNLDYHRPTGEAVWTELNPSYPTGVLQGPGCSDNMVMYSNKMGDLYPIFTNGNVLYGSTYIDGGQKVAVHSTNMGTGQWLYIDRSGATYPLPPDVEWNLWGTPDGYVFLGTGSGGEPQVRYHRFTGGATPTSFTLWTGVAGSGYWRIIWVNPITDGAGLAPFPPLGGAPLPIVTLPPAVTLVPPVTPVPIVTLPPAVTLVPAAVPLVPGVYVSPVPTLAPLAPPPVNVVPGARPSPVPTVVPLAPPVQVAPGVLTPGGRAMVNTTAGDMLRVRTGPGLGYGVAFQLASGTQVTIAEGPRSADGYTWWRLVTADGRSGWAVEGVTDGNQYIQTLQPL